MVSAVASTVMADPPRRRWSLESARAILPEIRSRTETAHATVEALTTQRAAAAQDPPSLAEIERELTRVVSQWVRAMEALGVDVKGAWLVDFDCGGGSYCWRWPEERLEFFHDDDAGFEGRIRIQ